MMDEKYKVRMVEAFRKKFKRLISEGKAKVNDIQEIDFEAEVDGSLSYKENNELLMDKYVIEEKKKDDYAVEEMEHIKEIENYHEQEFKESVKKLKGGEQDGFFKDLKAYVGMVGKGYQNSLIIEGRGGIGKTYEVLKTLNELEVEYEYISSYSTPLEFYQMLYEKNGKVLVLDDFEGILGDVGMSILKSALWSATDKRFVSYLTTSNKRTAPSKFEYTGRIIFCVNSLPDNPEMEALKTRSLYHELEFSTKDVQKIMVAIAKSSGEDWKEEVAQYIVNNTNECTKDLNLRTLVKSYGVYQYCQETGDDWKLLVHKLLGADEEKMLVKDLVEKHSTMKDAVQEFCEMTGKSRRTFFYLRKELK